MDQSIFVFSNPWKAAVDHLLDTASGRNSINWQTCQCIWDSTEIIDPGASADEVARQ